METINKEELLPILQNSELISQFEDKVTIPKKYMFTKNDVKIKYEISIENDEHFHEIMNKLRYHMVKELPNEIYEYVLINLPDISNYKDFFFDELTLLVTKEESKINVCAEKGFSNLMKYLIRNGHVWTKETANIASKNGNVECLKYCVAFGCSVSCSTLTSAVSGYWGTRNRLNIPGRVKCIKYLQKIGYQNDYLLGEAVRFGNIEILKALDVKRKVCIISVKITAVRYDRLECLKYLHELNNDWHPTTLDQAFFGKKFRCFEFAYKNGCTINNKYTELHHVGSKHIESIKEYVRNNM